MSKKEKDSLISITSYVKAKWGWHKTSEPYGCSELSEQTFIILDGDENSFTFKNKKDEKEIIYEATISPNNDRILIKKLGSDFVHRIIFNY